MESMKGADMQGRELLVGAYLRPDGTKYRVARIDGTQSYVVDVDGVRVDGTFSKAAAIKVGRGS